MTTRDPAEVCLAALRVEWHAARSAGDAERLVDIEGRAAQITAVRLLQTVLGATVATDTTE